MTGVVIKEVRCETAIGKCGFPGGGFSINPYIGCAHGCVYCYARFMKRFTNHAEDWGNFVDIKNNIAERTLTESKKIKNQEATIYVGTVTDPYQPIESHYRLTRSVLENLLNIENPVCILTKSDLVVRDIDVLKKLKRPEVNITVNNLDERWTLLTEPGSSPITGRLDAIRKISEAGIPVYAMMGPWWPIFSKVEDLLVALKNAGVSGLFSESVNTTGSNWVGVERILKKFYPTIFPQIKNILFNEKNFNDFYAEEEEKITRLAKQLKLPVKIYFARGHAANKLKQ